MTNPPSKDEQIKTVFSKETNLPQNVKLNFKGGNIEMIDMETEEVLFKEHNFSAIEHEYYKLLLDINKKIEKDDTISLIEAIFMDHYNAIVLGSENYFFERITKNEMEKNHD